MGRLLLFLMLVALGGAARADTILPFENIDEVSRDGRTRVTILPNHEWAGMEPLFVRLRVERRQGSGPWRLVTERSLDHDLPSRLVMGADGRSFATLGSYHWDEGGTADAIVIFRAEGQVVRRLTLHDIFPSWFVAVLPRSTSRIQWLEHGMPEPFGSSVNGPRISADGNILIVPVRVPSGDDARGPARDLHVAMADGRVLNLGEPQWRKELEVAKLFARAECANVRRMMAEDPEPWREVLADPQRVDVELAACEGPEATLLERVAAFFASIGRRVASLWNGGQERG